MHPGAAGAFGPPSTIQFRATAEVLATDDPVITALMARGKLRTITAHGELDLPDDCSCASTPSRRINTYGLGLPLRRLIRSPLDPPAT